MKRPMACRPVNSSARATLSGWECHVKSVECVPDRTAAYVTRTKPRRLGPAICPINSILDTPEPWALRDPLRRVLPSMSALAYNGKVAPVVRHIVLAGRLECQ